MARLRKVLARYPPAKAVYHGLRRGIVAAACRVSPSVLSRCRYRMAWKRWPHLAEPTTFDEKLQWLNLFWQHPLKTRCADKYELRGFVEEHKLAHVLPHLFGVYSSTDEIRVENLPEKFVLKCSHGWKCNVFCSDKSNLEWNAVKADLDSWTRTDFSLLAGEIHYARMTPRIICEEFLDDGSGQKLPTDYKVFCFAGKPHCTMTATDRDPNGTARLAFYNLNWEAQSSYCLPELAATEEIAKPAGYDEMLNCAAILSRPFPFVRVDFYSIKGRTILGEMTFTPGACVSADYMTEVAQGELGRLMELPERYVPRS